MSSNPFGFRISIRTEGKYVNAYLQPDIGIKSEVGPILMGSILLTIARRMPDAYNRWKEIMKDVITQACIELFDERPNLTESEAPESERGGNA